MYTNISRSGLRSEVKMAYSTEFTDKSGSEILPGAMNSHAKLTMGYIIKRETVKETLCLDGSHLELPHIVAVMENRNIKVKIAESSVEEMKENSAFLTKKLDEGAVLYAVNTGIGGSADVRSYKMIELQESVIRCLNAGMGRTFEPDIVRASMVIRANCLCKAYSGVRPDITQMMASLINNDIVPKVPLRGSVSASGDLIPLSYVAATMMGREDLNVSMNGQEMACSEAIQRANLEPIVFGPKEAVAVINSVSFTAGHATSTLYDANLVLLLTQVCTGLAVEGLNGTTESFHPITYQCLPHVGQREIAKNMLNMLNGSKLATTVLDMYLPDQQGVLKQNRYSMRTSPQWLGPVAETLLQACRRVAVELNAVDDNPIIDHRTSTIANGGNFQGETLSITMDQTRQVLGLCGKLLFAQFSEAVNHHYNSGLPPNLGGADTSFNFGFKGADVAMAAYMSELDHLVNPMSNHVLSAELHNQSVNSLALISARLTKEALEIIQMMVANHLILLVQAVDLRHLQHLVLLEIEELKAMHPEASHVLERIEWYNLLSLTNENASDPPRNVNAEHLEGFVRTAERRMHDLFVKMVRGEAGTEDQLGEGTKKMYQFIRRYLGVPFYHEQYRLDCWLQKTLDAIQGRSVEGVLVDIFSHE